MNLCTTCDQREPMSSRASECRQCYNRRYYAEKVKPLRVPPVPYADRRDPISYQAAHHRVRVTRGRAAEHLCSRCGDYQAAQWAYQYGDEHEQSGPVTNATTGVVTVMFWSSNPHAYAPMCRTCHRFYDDAQRIEREVQRRLKEVRDA